MLDFRDQVLVLAFTTFAEAPTHGILFQASPKDIEDLANAGRMAGTCPYFGSRRAIPQAEVLTVSFFTRAYIY